MKFRLRWFYFRKRSNVNKKKLFSEDDLNSLSLLLENMSHLDQNDPLHQLILSLKEMRNLYA